MNQLPTYVVHGSSDRVSDVAGSDDALLVAALQEGDEDAFAALIEAYHGSMMRIALIYVPATDVADEVIQETWLAVFQGLAQFAGRSSLKTWIFRILTNIAKTRGEREGRSLPFSSFEDRDDDRDEFAVPPERFRSSEPGQGSWRTAPSSWENGPEWQALSTEIQARIAVAIAALPAQQREVIQLRDVVGCAAEEVCALLDISTANQRVLLHRARAKVRSALEVYFAAEQNAAQGQSP